MDQLTPTDATHILVETGAHVSRIVDAYIFDPDGLPADLDLDAVLAWVGPRIRHSPMFRSRIRRYPADVDLPYWQPDPNFDLRAHVAVEAAPGPGWPAVRDRIAELCRTRVPLERPPWSLLVITGVTGVDGVPDGACVVVFKVHHAVGDGVEVVALARDLFAPEPPAPGALPAAVSPGGAAARAVLRLPVVVFRFARGGVRAQILTRAAQRAAARGEVSAPRWRWPSTRFNRRPGPGFAFDAVSVDLDEIDRIRSRLPGVTVTEVVSEVIGDAMVTYLREHGEQPPASLGGKVALSMRGTLASRSRNNFVVLSVDLHTDLADRVRRVAAIHESMTAEKVRFRHPAIAELSAVLDSAPAPYVRRLQAVGSRLPIGEGDTVALGNTMISNVPRRAEGVRFFGSRVIGGFGILGIGAGSCLNHYIVSTGRTLTVTFAVDPDRMPDIDRYAALLRGSFRELAAAAARVETHPVEPPL
ncbi:wax ester/triacylglycerol synthase domain-containing protein [Rhodococcus sp. NPDC054953]